MDDRPLRSNRIGLVITAFAILDDLSREPVSS